MWHHFFKKNPYLDFPIEDYTMDIQGWGDEHPIFPTVLQRIRPKVIIEVGTWKGFSALHMAHILRELKIDGHIICIDTFLGSAEHYLQPDLYDLMTIKNGRPDLYNQFLANVIFQKQEERITPLPMDADGAITLLTAKKIMADVIYVDGAHDYEHVSHDLDNYWKVLSPGGVIIGDDYSFDTVKRAADDFSKRMGVTIHVGEGKYLFEKPNNKSVDIKKEVTQENKKSLEVILRTHTTGNMRGNAERVTDNLGGKSELVLRGIWSLVRSLLELDKSKKADITLSVYDDHSDKESIRKMRQILNVCPFKTRFVELKDTGAVASLKAVYTAGRNSSSELVYFIEDDYLHQESALTEMVEAWTRFSRAMGNENIGIYPVDYIHRYTRDPIGETRVVLGANRHWRIVERTTGSFLVTQKIIQKYWEYFLFLTENGLNEDGSINELWRKYVVMWSPLPTLAYHMNGEEEMPPYSDWKKLWDTLGDYPIHKKV